MKLKIASLKSVLVTILAVVSLVGHGQQLKTTTAGLKAKNYNQVSIVLPEHPEPALKIAATELSKYLSKLYSGLKINLINQSELKGKYSSGAIIYIGKNSEIKEYLKESAPDLPTKEEGYVIKPLENQGKIYGAYIAGGSNRAVLNGVYGLLEKLGCGFYQSTEVVPPGKSDGLNLSLWQLADSPLVEERFMFAWPNFLTGCSGWDRADWMQWIVQSQKQGINTIMVHAYPNDPVFTYKFNGIEKPVGYWPNSAIGRGWSNTNINDVRRMPSGDAIASGPVFASEFSKDTTERRISIAQNAMYDVFKAAHDRDMKVNFAFDFDKVNAFPKELLTGFAKSELIGGAPNPETPKGYAFYKAQIEGLLKTYPQITTLTLWHTSYGIFEPMKESSLPEDWKKEFEAVCQRNSRVKELGRNGLTMFLTNKFLTAYRKAIDETGRNDVKLAFGTWYFNNSDLMEAAVLVLPKEVNIIPLDYSILSQKSMFDSERSDVISKWSDGRIMPVIWNQHDDGSYLGKPAHMVSNFESQLKNLNASGFGMIHWMIRPYDLFYKWHNRQVWDNSKNESLEKTTRQMAIDWCGPDNADIIGKYLSLWAMEAPGVGRATEETFFRHDLKESLKNAPKLIALCEERLRLLDKVDTRVMTASQKKWLQYFKLFEKALIAFCDAQDRLQKANELVVNRKYDEAGEILQKIDAPAVIESYAKMVRLMPDDKGQKAMVLRLGYAWYGEVVCLRQMAGLEPLRICFGRTISEPLSNDIARNNDFFDKEGKMWRQYGENELPTFTTVNDKTIAEKQKDITSSLKEITHQGLVINHPLNSFVVEAINKYVRTWNGGELRPGNYEMTLLLRRQSPGKDPVKFNINVSDDENGASTSVSKDIELPASNEKEVITVKLKMKLNDTGKAYLNIKLKEGGAVVLSGLTFLYDGKLNNPAKPVSDEKK